MKNERSVVVPTALSSDVQKLGHAAPLSNVVSDAKRGRSQPAQWTARRRYSLSSGLLKARSVPCLRSTVNAGSLRLRRHSASVFVTSKVLSMSVAALQAVIGLPYAGDGGATTAACQGVLRRRVNVHPMTSGSGGCFLITAHKYLKP